MFQSIPDPREGDPISAEWLNRLIEEIVRRSKLTVEAPLQLSAEGSGYRLRLNQTAVSS